MEQETSLFEKIKQTLKHGVIYGIGTSLQQGITIILIPLYTAYLSTAQYGALGLIRSTAGILSTIAALGLVSAFFRSYYDYEDEKSKNTVLSTAITLMLISGIIVITLAFIFSKHLSILLFNNAEYQFHIFIGILISVLTALTQIPFTLFRVKRKSVLYSVLQILFMTSGIAFSFYFVAYRKLGVLGVLFGNLSMVVISIVLLYFFIRENIAFRFSIFEAKKMLAYGTPLIFANLSSFVFNFSDRYILNYFRSLDEVGIYNLGYKFGMILMILFVTPVKLIGGPMSLSVMKHANAKEFYKRAFTYSVFIGAILFLAVGMFSEEAIHILAHKNYHGAYKVVPLVSLSYILWGIKPFVHVGFTIKRKTKMIALYFFIGAITNVILNFIFIPKFGMMGAAFTTLVAFIVMFIFVYIYNKKLMNIKYELNRIFKICLITAIIFAISLLFPNNNLILSIAYKTLALLSFPFLLYFTNFYLDSEKLRIKKLFKFQLRR